MIFLVPTNMERERKEAASKEGTLLSAEQLHVGSMQQSCCQPGGDRFTLGNIAGFPGWAGLELPCSVLGKEAGEKQRGELGICRSFYGGTAQLASNMPRTGYLSS